MANQLNIDQARREALFGAGYPTVAAPSPPATVPAGVALRVA
jgi:hypothetical protein